jgi:TonB family protein
VKKTSFILIVLILELFVFKNAYSEDIRTDKDTLLIIIEQNAILVDNKKIANTADVAEQAPLIIEALKNTLKNKKEKNIQIQITPDQSYDVLFKVVVTCHSFSTNISIISQIEGKNYNETILLPNANLEFTYIVISKKGRRICLSGGYLPTLHTHSDYYWFTNSLTTLYNHIRFDNIIILSESDVKVSNIIPVTSSAKAAGFTKIHFAMLTEPFVRGQSIEPENCKKNTNIIQINGELHSVRMLCGSGRREKYRSKNEIMDTMNVHMPDLKSIYRNYFKEKPGFGGKVILKFSIAPEGNIDSIKIVSTTTDYPEFDKAVKEMVATWKWEPKCYSTNTTPTIPFNFTEEMLSEL